MFLFLVFHLFLDIGSSYNRRQVWDDAFVNWPWESVLKIHINRTKVNVDEKICQLFWLELIRLYSRPSPFIRAFIRVVMSCARYARLYTIVNVRNSVVLLVSRHGVVVLCDVMNLLIRLRLHSINNTTANETKPVFIKISRISDLHIIIRRSINWLRIKA